VPANGSPSVVTMTLSSIGAVSARTWTWKLSVSFCAAHRIAHFTSPGVASGWTFAPSRR